MCVCVTPHRGLPVDAPVGLAQGLDDLQGVQQLVGALDPQQVLPAQTLSTLHAQTQTILNMNI